MLEQILSDDFGWSEDKIAIFNVLLVKTGVKEFLDTELKRLQESGKTPSTKKEWLTVLNGLLQKHFFCRMTENGPSETVLLKPLETLVGKKLTVTQERFQMPDFDLNALKENMSRPEEEQALNFIVEVRDILVKMGIFDAAQIAKKEDSKDSKEVDECEILSILGASFPPAYNRIQSSENLAKSAQHIFLVSGQRKTETEIDLKPFKAAGFEGEPKTELEAMQIVAGKVLRDHLSKVISIDAPMRPDPKKPAEFTLRPDTTFTFVCAGKEIAKMLADGRLKPNQKIRIKCVTEAPNHGPQFQQVLTGLQQSGLSKEVLDSIQVTMAGPGCKSLNSSKSIFLALSAIAGEVFAVTQRPTLKPVRENKINLEEAAAAVIGKLTGNTSAAGYKPLDKAEETYLTTQLENALRLGKSDKAMADAAVMDSVLAESDKNKGKTAALASAT